MADNINNVDDNTNIGNKANNIIDNTNNVDDNTNVSDEVLEKELNSTNELTDIIDRLNFLISRVSSNINDLRNTLKNNLDK